MGLGRRGGVSESEGQEQSRPPRQPSAAWGGAVSLDVKRWFHSPFSLNCSF